jgi:hypothetical protein
LTRRADLRARSNVRYKARRIGWSLPESMKAAKRFVIVTRYHSDQCQEIRGNSALGNLSHRGMAWRSQSDFATAGSRFQHVAFSLHPKSIFSTELRVDHKRRCESKRISSVDIGSVEIKDTNGIQESSNMCKSLKRKERETGIEPATSSLGKWP